MPQGHSLAGTALLPFTVTPSTVEAVSACAFVVSILAAAASVFWAINKNPKDPFTPIAIAAACVSTSMYLLALLAWLPGADGLTVSKTPPGADFSAFYNAGTMAASAPLGATYDTTATQASFAELFGLKTLLPWHYPPSAALLLIPLAALPYPLALGLWLATGVGVLALVLRPLLTNKRLTLAALTFPGFATSIVYGQNGLLTAAAFGALLLGLGKETRTAALAVALLTLKPHLGILIPIALIAARKWVMIRRTIAYAVVLHGTAFAITGPEPWIVWLDTLGQAASRVATILPAHAMPTWSSALYLEGLPPPARSLTQGASALAAAGLTWWVFASNFSDDAKAAILPAATLAVSPYIFSYDWALLGITGLFAWRALPDCSSRTMICLAIWLAPIVLSTIGHGATHQPGPVLLTVVLATLSVILFRRRNREILV